MDYGKAMQLNWKKSRRRSIRPNGWMLVLIFCFMTVFIENANARREQGRLADRRYSIRKTGQFGRRIPQDNLIASASTSTSTSDRSPPHLSQHLELPLSSSPTLKTRFRTAASSPEVVYLKQVVGGVAGGNPNRLEIRKPSLDLELPKFSGQGHNFLKGFDQIAEETEDNEGYAYPDPTTEDNTEGYQYPEPRIKPNEPLVEEDTQAPEQPDPSQPEVVAADQIFGLQKPETDIDIDADSLRPQKSKPDVVGVPSDTKTDDHSDKICPEDGSDPSCWPHGYTGVIPGKAGEDYPILSEIIDTGFTCDEMPYSGYYADTSDQARCQMFHICLKKNRWRKTQQWSFLCPNGTIFSQPDFVCVWWGDAQECSDVMIRSMYNLNEQLGWDNQTETGSSGAPTGKRGGSAEKLQTAMSTFNAAAAATAKKSSSNALPYRVPVKVPSDNGRSRTKLQEVTPKDNLEDLEYGGEESNNFETSLSSQAPSLSEGYPDGEGEGDSQPFVVNRPEAPTDNPPPSQREYDNQEVVMMPSMQRFPDGSEGYAEVPVMFPTGGGGGSGPSGYQYNPPDNQPTHENYQQDGSGSEDDVGYQYPNPTTTQGTSTPAPTYLPPRRTTSAPRPAPPKSRTRFRTTTEYYPPPTIPTEPPIPEDPQQSQSYQEDPNQQDYQRIQTTTDKPLGDDDEGYRYPEPQQVTTTEQSNQIYDQTESDDGYSYPNPQQSDKQQQQQVDFQDSSDGYPGDLSTTTENYFNNQNQEDDQGYRYPNPTTTQRSSRYRQPQTTTEVVTESTITPDIPQDSDDIGYNYPAPESGPSQQFESLRETTTTSSTSTSTTDNYEYSTQQFSNLQDNSVTTATTEVPSSQTTEVDLPPGGYLPPKFSPQIRQESVTTSQPPPPSPDVSSEDQVDYEDDVEEGPSTNEVDGGASSSGGDESGYNYNIPTAPPGGGNDVVLNGGSLDSDEKLNEILKQIQSGGIEAVDSQGRPIEFNKLKELLLNSPRGSVELKSGGDLDTVTSSTSTSTVVPPTTPPPSSTSQQNGGDGQGYQQSSPQQPIYHTVSTATVLPPTPSNSQSSNNFKPPFTSSLPDYYLPPNDSPPNNRNNNNEIFQNYDQPSYSINLPSREFQSHSVSVAASPNLNTIPVENLNQNYNYAPASAPASQNSQQFRQQQPQSGYYQSNQQSPNPSAPSLQNYYQLPQNNYLPPSSAPPPPPPPSSPQPQFTQDYERTNILNNLILPSPQPQRQQQNGGGGGLSPPPLPPSSEYLPPRQATSSILQPQYYQSPSKYLGQPIRLTDNIELQQSFAIPTPQPLNLNPSPNDLSSNNPLVDPKNIKIVPALFVHEHTSVQSHQDGPPKSSIHDAFQTLDTAQSTYYSTTTSLPSNGGGGGVQRQFFRRSNSPSSSPSPPSHIIEQAHQVTSFTLEDARTPEELQKYHHQDLKRFHKETIVNGGGGVILQDDQSHQQYNQPPPQRSPPPTRKTLPVIASIAREPQRESRGRKEGGGGGGDGGTPTRFSIPSRGTSGGGGDGGEDIISSHRNEEYFIPVSGSLGGGGGGGVSSSGSSSSGGRSRNGGGGGIVRNSNRDSSSNTDNYSQFRVSGSAASRGGSGGGGRSSESFNFVEPSAADQTAAFWSKQLFL